jgi:hypothetical protein
MGLCFPVFESGKIFVREFRKPEAGETWWSPAGPRTAKRGIYVPCQTVFDWEQKKKRRQLLPSGRAAAERLRFSYDYDQLCEILKYEKRA